MQPIFLKKVIWSTAFSFLMTFGFVATVSAITISPPTKEFSGSPGDVLVGSVRLYNELNQPVVVYPRVQNFRASSDESGSPTLYAADQDPYGIALAQWIVVSPKGVDINPKQAKTIPFTINIPKAATPGGHYGAILFGTSPPSKGGAVGVGAEVASLLLVRVSGDVKESARLAEFSVAQTEAQRTSLPVDFVVRIENTGTVHIQPTGTVTIKNMFGNTVSVVPLNTTARNVLPQSIRRFSLEWARKTVSSNASILEQEWKNFALGSYTALLTVNYAAGKQTIIATQRFTVFPWHLLLVVLVGLVISLLTAWQGIRRYNAWVLRRARRE